MKLIITLITLTLLSFHAVGQDQDLHLKDLEALNLALQKTPGYRDQIRGERKKAYDLLFQELKSASIGPSALDTFYHFSRLLGPIRDMHLGFWQVWDRTVSMDKLQDSAYISAYQHTPAFKKVSFVTLNLDSLQHALQKMPLDSIEGIYSAGKFGTVGIFRTKVRDSLVAACLSPGFRNSRPGEIFGIFREHSKDKFRGVYVSPITKSLIYSRDIGFQKGIFSRLELRKPGASTRAELWNTKPFTYGKLSGKFQYLHLGSFQSSNSNLKVAKAFHDQVKDSLSAPDLIVDLRGNSGGGDRCSEQFLKLIRTYARHGRVHILVNRFVMSNAEQFTLKLKGRKNVKVYGETTAGVIAYGKNYGDPVTLPSGRFQLYNTDMKDTGNYLRYEEVGIAPDIPLNESSDWISQVMALIGI
ncbi:S41 family peptidase [Pedobacter sp. JY14-1]|uniref:S41 family peptidase n=1 Tax=Pedobacter sp. JY14-1 TaxID=3034151 RepID=UPI0023E251B0|nr:S41 family peptidase [Pedobacter sp. JY14-1]